MLDMVAVMLTVLNRLNARGSIHPIRGSWGGHAQLGSVSREHSSIFSGLPSLLFFFLRAPSRGSISSASALRFRPLVLLLATGPTMRAPPD